MTTIIRKKVQLFKKRNEFNPSSFSSEQIIDIELKKIENFEKQFTLLLKNLLEKLDLSIHSSLYRDKKIKVLPEQTIKTSIKTLFQILYELLERYPLQSYLKWSNSDSKDYNKMVSMVFLELMKSFRRIKNYFITHTNYDFAYDYCNNYSSLKIYNKDHIKSLCILEEIIEKEKGKKLFESVNTLFSD